MEERMKDSTTPAMTAEQLRDKAASLRSDVRWMENASSLTWQQIQEMEGKRAQAYLLEAQAQERGMGEAA
jgi:hypothetical protein